MCLAMSMDVYGLSKLPTHSPLSQTVGQTLTQSLRPPSAHITIAIVYALHSLMKRINGYSFINGSSVSIKAGAMYISGYRRYSPLRQ